MVGETLDRPRHVQEDGGLLERHRSDAGAVAGEILGELPCDPAHDEVELARVAADVQTTDRPDLGHREVPAEEAVPFTEDDAGAGACGRDRRAETGRSTPGHDHVGVDQHVGLTRGDTHSRKVPPHPRHALASQHKGVATAPVARRRRLGRPSPQSRSLRRRQKADRGPRPWVWCLGRAGRLFHERRPMTARRPRPPHPRTGTPNRARHRPGRLAPCVILYHAA